jgi:hypothetical protein
MQEEKRELGGIDTRAEQPQVLDSKGWCERGESNPYGCPLDPKSSASASSATLASLTKISELPRHAAQHIHIIHLMSFCAPACRHLSAEGRGRSASSATLAHFDFT